MKIAITIVEVPSDQGSWKPAYASLLPPAKAVQQWYERHALASPSTVLNRRAEFVEMPRVRAWTVRVPAMPDRRPWIVRALKWIAREVLSMAHLMLFGPPRRSNARTRGRLGAR